MANTRILNRSFAGGVISPQMYGRIDDVKYQSGAALLQNFLATPQGQAKNRAGFAYVNSTKNNGVARLIPFTYSSDQTMVIEMGAGYFRFHTQGETLVYDPSQPSWVAPSGAITLSLTTPTVVNWPAHGLTTGDPIVFYLYGGTQFSDLPAGLQVGYVYTVNVIDANSFNIIDNGVALNLPGGGSSGSTYTGAGTASVYASCGEDSSDYETSAFLTGLGNNVIAGGYATLTVTLSASAREIRGGAGVDFLYYNGVTWATFYSTSTNYSGTVSVQIPIANSNLLKLQISAAVQANVKGSASASGSITAWSLTDPGGGGGSTTFSGVRAYRNYPAGSIVTYSGSAYSAVVESVGGRTVPGTDPAVWLLLPASVHPPYEISNSYAEADLFDVHYVQSADVMTLVHPKYPPAELKRLGATVWSFSPIQFEQVLVAPAGVTAMASPGFLVRISSESGGVYTTESNHTLAYGDGVYVAADGGTLASGFYLISEIPVDSSGNPIKNQLKLMDYDGNAISGAVGGNTTIQYGGKIFDITNYYVVTALTADGLNESPVSQEVSVLDNLNVTGSYNTISWQAVTGAARYYVYKKKNGLYGFIGETPNLSFNDNNIAPDFSITPPRFDPIFTGSGDYPGAVSYFDQRRTFAGTINTPQDVWMSKTGTESDFSYSIPIKDTDRINFRVATREANTIRHIVPMTQLLLLTSSTELRVSTGTSDAISPTNVSVRPQSYVGSSNVQPSIINNSLVYCAARGGHVRELGYQWTANAFVTGDVSLRAAHLFDNLSIIDQSFQKAPLPVVWFVSSSGNLLGLTYIPEEQIGAWHQHTTDGVFESIATVSEGSEDRLYAVIRRTINGNTVRYIERMASRIIDENDSSTWFFVDSGSTYNGAPATTISGLDWLEGKTVSILADGAVQPQQTVTDGKITLSRAASVVHVGLPYISDLQTLPLTLQIDGFGMGRTKNINKVWVRTWQSGGVFAGPTLDRLAEFKQRSDEPYGAPPKLKSDELQITIFPSWQQSGQVYVRQVDPLPLGITGITMEVAIGG